MHLQFPVVANLCLSRRADTQGRQTIDNFFIEFTRKGLLSMSVSARRQLITLFIVVLVSAILAAGSRQFFHSRPKADGLGNLIRPEYIKESVQDAEQSSVKIRLIPLEIFRDLVSSRSAIIVDARLGSAYSEGHVPGAINFPALRPKQEVLKKILQYPKNSTVVVYCESANCSESKSVAEILQNNEMRNVRVLIGGWKQWLSHGLPIETGFHTGLEHGE